MRVPRTHFRTREGEAPAEPSPARRRLSRSFALPGTLAILLTCSGCWEEIRYVPKPAAVQPVVENEEHAEQAPEEPAAAAKPAEGAAATPEAAAAEDTILPTPDKLAAMLDPAIPEEAEDALASRAVPAPAPTSDDRQLAWEAASKWSLAAAIYAKGLAAPRYEPILDEAKAAAAKLQIELPPLPTTQQADDLEATVIEGLRGESAVALTNAFAKRFGPAEAAAADLAIRSHLLLLTYSPRSGDAALQAEALRRAAGASGLPTETWEPLVTLLDDRAPFVAVRQAVFELDDRVDEHLSDAGK